VEPPTGKKERWTKVSWESPGKGKELEMILHGGRARVDEQEKGAGRGCGGTRAVANGPLLLRKERAACPYFRGLPHWFQQDTGRSVGNSKQLAKSKKQRMKRPLMATHGNGPPSRHWGEGETVISSLVVLEGGGCWEKHRCWCPNFLRRETRENARTWLKEECQHCVKGIK